MKFYADTICHTLENGVQVYLFPQPVSSVIVQCVVRTGSIHESSALGCGLSHFLEHMMFQGCDRYPGTSASDTIDALGGNINAYTSFDHTSYYAEAAGYHLLKIIDVIGSMVRHPHFPEERFKSEREVILREQELGQDNPDHRLFEVFNGLLYKHHPLRVPIIGHREMIASVTREMMCSYYEKRYTPGRTFWVITGNFEPAAALEAVRQQMADWTPAHLAEQLLPEEPPLCQQRKETFQFDDPLTRLAVGFQLPPVTDRDIPALDIASGILAQGDGSRLIRILKMEKTLAVTLRSYCMSIAGRGFSGIFGAAVPAKLAKLETALLKELENIRKNGFTTPEIKREKTQQMADTLRNQRSLREVAANIVSGVVAADSPALSDRYMERLNAVTPDEVNAAAAKYFNADTFAVVRQEQPQKRTVCAAKCKSAAIQPQTAVLAKGTRCVTMTDRRLPLVEVSLLLPGGAIFEPASMTGVSGLVADTLFSGAGKYSETALLEAFDACGAEININAGLNSLMLDMSVPRKSFRKALDLLGTMLGSPRFEADASEREKQNRLELIRSRRQDPKARAAFECSRLLYGNHPYSWGTLGLEEAFGAITPEEAAAFYRSLWNRGQVIFGFGGDCTPDEAFRWGCELDDMIAFNAPAIPLPPPPVFPAEPQTKHILLPREQTAVLLALPGPPLKDDRLNDCEILQHAENGLSSTLFKRIREDNALAYTTGFQLSGGFHAGQFRFFAITGAASAEKAAGLLREEVQRLAAEGLTEAEFNAAREGAVFAVSKIADSVAAALPGLLLELHYGHPANELFSHREKLLGRSRDGVNRLLKEYFSNAVTVEVHAGKMP
ncbi:MAG: insulinase family protein [Lentisphaeria bacterium]|nr:insulinase family protein [Lentisphaeria bacterium]